MVSIHAPTRGATRRYRGCTSARRWFQSTRPRGARPAAAEIGANDASFQSTRPRGARRTAARGIYRIGAVSIHAPTRGATAQQIAGLREAKCFNPRAHAGRDLGAQKSAEVVEVFQSTRPRGARLAVGRWGNYRKPEFQSTRPRGARPARRRIHPPDPTGFNPRAHAGRDSLSDQFISLLQEFQSTRPRGARPQRADAVARVIAVSIHAPTRGATGFRGWPARG